MTDQEEPKVERKPVSKFVNINIVLQYWNKMNKNKMIQEETNLMNIEKQSEY